jgi:hypothetical protein
MIELTRAQIVGALQHDWATYVERFQRLSPEAQAAFLDQQGYARLGDLLAHIIAWWEDGQQVIGTWLDDPGFNAPEYEVDSFNAQAVERFRPLTETAVIQSFEHTRQTWLNLVTGLPAEAFQNHKIVDRLHVEVVDHLAEHALP